MDPIRFERGWSNALVLLLALLLLLLPAGHQQARAGGLEALRLETATISDPLTGIAIFGYDPIAYFVNGQAVPGDPAIEPEAGGMAWRFSSLANRAAFLDQPALYAPAGGGFDPVAAARGLRLAGDPEVFAIVGQQLYFFRSAAERRGFLARAQAASRDSARASPSAMKPCCDQLAQTVR